MGPDEQSMPETAVEQPQRTAEQVVSGNGGIAPEVLVRFWPDLFRIPMHQKLGATIPGRSGRVNPAELATHLLALPLFTLVRDGAAQAQNTDRKLLGLLPLRRVAISPTGTGVAAAGIAAALLPQQGSPDARSVVYSWFKKDVPDPAKYVLQVADQVAHRQGFYTTEQPPPHRTGLVGRKVQAPLVYHPIVDRVSATREPAEQLAAQWHDFGMRDPEVRARLLDRVSKGIRSRKESDDDDEGFDFNFND